MYDFLHWSEIQDGITAGYILTQDLYNVKINKMIFERDLIEHKLAYE